MPRVGLIGSPLTHSLSPLLHETLYRLAGVNARYELWDIPADQWPNDFKTQLERDWLGLNVTTPHKERALAAADVTSEAPMLLGAVNHLMVRPDGTVAGDNKDVDGAYFTLQGIRASNPGRSPEWLRDIHIMGFGPAARAVIIAHQRHWRAERQRIKTHTNRDPGRGQVHLYVRKFHPDLETWRAKLQEAVSETVMISLHPWSALAASPLNGMLVNATTVKHEPLFETLPQGKYGVWDLNYGSPTPLLVTQAKSAGHFAIDGLPMLVWQGFFSAARWFPNEIKPQEQMGLATDLLRTLREALE